MVQAADEEEVSNGFAGLSSCHQAVALRRHASGITLTNGKTNRVR